MKIRTSFFAFLVLMLVATGFWSSSPALMAGKSATASKSIMVRPYGAQDFTVVNHTGVVISALYVSPTHVNDWEEDILGQDVLGDGESLLIKFARSEKAEHWDIRIEDSHGNALIWEGLNLLEISKVNLFYDNGHATATVE